VVQDDVRDAKKVTVARDRHNWDLYPRRKRSVHRDQAFNRPLLQEERVFFEEQTTMAMANDEIEVTFLEEVIFDPRQNECRVSFANFWDNHTNGVTSLLSE
jgi:hypothetical protein